jgi:DnaK suppressor protein
MPSSRLEKHRQMLLEIRDRLSEDINRRVETIPEIVFRPGDTSSVPTHPADEDTEGLVRELAVGETQESMRHAVDESLKRIDEGTYGRCLGCGRKIAAARLNAIPYTEFCIDCERRREEEEAEFGRGY